MTRKIILLSGAALSIILSSAAAAQTITGKRPPLSQSTSSSGAADESQEIIVTAQRIAESSQQVPISIQAVGSEALARRDITNFNDLTQAVPGFNFAIQGTQPVIALRGASGEIYGLAGDPSVQVSQDGVPFASQEYVAAGFLDVQRIEVLRGPQGTVAGRNSTAGAMNIISNPPTHLLSAGLNATVGNFDRRSVDGFVSGPLIDGALYARLAFRVDDRGGILNNLNSENPGRFGNDKAERTARLSLEYAPIGSKFTALLSGWLYRNETSGAPYRYQGTAIPYGQVIDAQAFVTSHRIVPILPTNGPVYDPRALDVNILYRLGGPKANITTRGATLRLDYNIGSDWNISSISGYRSYDFSTTQAADAAITSAAWALATEKAHQLSEEVNLTGHITPAFDMLVGGIYLSQRGTIDLDAKFFPTSLIPLISPFTGFRAVDQQNLDSSAVFGQLRWRPLPGLQLTAGGRYTHDSKTFDESVYVPDTTFAFDNSTLGFPSPARLSYNTFTPRVAIDYNPVSNVTLYGSYAEGFKAGGFSVAALFSAHSPHPFEPEHVKTFEIGAKTQWFDRALTINIAAFSSDFHNLQVQLPTSFGEQVTNAATARIRGVELEVTARPTKALSLGLNATYLDAKFRQFCPLNETRPDLYATNPTLTVAQCGLASGTVIPFGSQNMADKPLPRAPQWSGSATAAYTFDLGKGREFTLDGAYSFTSRIFFTGYDELLRSQKLYGLLDLRATYRPTERWSISAWAKNVTDVRYVKNVIGSPAGLAQLTVAGNPATLVPGTPLVGVIGDPRTYGLTAGYRF
jgi:iron complex outermembrane receptor protein